MHETTQQLALDLPIPPARTPTIPDWSMVVAPNARMALDGVYTAGKWDRRRGGLDVVSSRVLAAVLRHYAEAGSPPITSRLAATLSMPDSAIDESLRRLAQHDLLLLNRDTGAIEGAYPFTEKVTGHSVTFRRMSRTISTMCAIDALGAGAMCREDVTIRSACGLCRTTIIGQVESAVWRLGM